LDDMETNELILVIVMALIVVYMTDRFDRR